MLRFNPSIGLTSVPTYSGALATGAFTLFQSLNRAYKRSDGERVCRGQCHFDVSIPQSGLQAFRLLVVIFAVLSISLFQSLNRAYKRSDHPGLKRRQA